MKLHIKNGRLIDPAAGHDAPADLFVAEGRIVGRGQAPEGFVADRVIDAAGLIVAPGLVDLSARLREPGHEGALKREMAAALAGGVTGLACPPDTDPPIDEPSLVRELRQRSREAKGARLYPVGALTVGLAGETLAEIETLAEVGCVAFAQTGRLPRDNRLLYQALRYAKTHELPVWLRPLDASLTGSGVAASGPVAGRLGLPGVPVAAETVALQTILELMRETGARVHLRRLSSASGLDIVRAAKREGLPLTAEVGIHHVHLTDVDIGYFDTAYRLDPPLRSQRDREAIRAALADGTLDAISSDHAPCSIDAKLRPFEEAKPGATGLEVLLPLTLKWAHETRTPLVDALAKVTSASARVLREDTGTLAVGAKADVVVFDPAAPWRVGADTLVSAGKNSPYSGLELEGRVCFTIVGGELRFERR